MTTPRRCPDCGIILSEVEDSGEFTDAELAPTGRTFLCVRCGQNEHRWLDIFPPQKRCVYFVSGADLVKIGYTTDLKKRLSALRTMSPVPLKLEYAISGGRELETALHRKFHARRQNGEWFDLNHRDIFKITTNRLYRVALHMTKTQLPSTPRLLKI